MRRGDRMGRTLRRTADNTPSRVETYIASAPVDVQSRLRTVRKAIRAAVPDATEVFSYRMPGYSYPGYDHKGVFAWFGLQSHHVGLYLRPPTIESHRRDLRGYRTTQSAVHLPLDRDTPVRLVQKLVKTSARLLKARGL